MTLQHDAALVNDWQLSVQVLTGLYIAYVVTGPDKHLTMTSKPVCDAERVKVLATTIDALGDF